MDDQTPTSSRRSNISKTDLTDTPRMSPYRTRSRISSTLTEENVELHNNSPATRSSTRRVTRRMSQNSENNVVSTPMLQVSKRTRRSLSAASDDLADTPKNKFSVAQENVVIEEDEAAEENQPSKSSLDAVGLIRKMDSIGAMTNESKSKSSPETEPDSKVLPKTPKTETTESKSEKVSTDLNKSKAANEESDSPISQPSTKDVVASEVDGKQQNESLKEPVTESVTTNDADISTSEMDATVNDIVVLSDNESCNFENSRCDPNETVLSTGSPQSVPATPIASKNSENVKLKANSTVKLTKCVVVIPKMSDVIEIMDTPTKSQNPLKAVTTKTPGKVEDSIVDGTITPVISEQTDNLTVVDAINKTTQQTEEAVMSDTSITESPLTRKIQDVIDGLETSTQSQNSSMDATAKDFIEMETSTVPQTPEDDKLTEETETIPKTPNSIKEAVEEVIVPETPQATQKRSSIVTESMTADSESVALVHSPLPRDTVPSVTESEEEMLLSTPPPLKPNLSESQQVGAKPERATVQHESADTQSETADAQPETADTQPETADKQPDSVDTQSEAADTQPEAADKQPEPAEKQPEPADTQPDAADKQPEVADKQPEAADKQPEAANKQPEAADKQTESADTQPESTDTEPEQQPQPEPATAQPQPEPTTAEPKRGDEQPKTAEAQPEPAKEQSEPAKEQPELSDEQPETATAQPEAADEQPESADAKSLGPIEIIDSDPESKLPVKSENFGANEELLLPKWGSVVCRNSDGEPIDRFGISNTEDASAINVFKKEPKDYNSDSVGYSNEAVDGDEESSSENEGVMSFIDNEAMESNGESSMDEEERRYIEENQIPEDGISLGSESDAVSSDGSASNDSFIVPDSHVDLLDGSGDDLELEYECNKPKTSNKKRRSHLIFDSSDEESENPRKSSRRSSVIGPATPIAIKKAKIVIIESDDESNKMTENIGEDELANLDAEPIRNQRSKRLSESNSLPKTEKKRLSLHPNTKLSSLESNVVGQVSGTTQKRGGDDSSKENIEEELENLDDEPKKPLQSRRLSESVSTSKKGSKRLSLHPNTKLASADVTMGREASSTENNLSTSLGQSSKQDTTEQISNHETEPSINIINSKRLSDSSSASQNDEKRLSLHPNTKPEHNSTPKLNVTEQTNVNNTKRIARSCAPGSSLISAKVIERCRAYLEKTEEAKRAEKLKNNLLPEDKYLKLKEKKAAKLKKKQEKETRRLEMEALAAEKRQLKLDKKSKMAEITEEETRKAIAKALAFSQVILKEKHKHSKVAEESSQEKVVKTEVKAPAKKRKMLQILEEAPNVKKKMKLSENVQLPAKPEGFTTNSVQVRYKRTKRSVQKTSAGSFDVEGMESVEFFPKQRQRPFEVTTLNYNPSNKFDNIKDKKISTSNVPRQSSAELLNRKKMQAKLRRK